MTTFQKEYSLNKTKQLIDLNGDSTNFRIKFTVRSKNNQPFDLTVVDQTTLDNNPSLQYEKATNGQRSGEIMEDKNIYQNYFLVLRADEPCQVLVDITKEELPKTQPPLPLPSSPNPKEDGFNWVKILLVVGVIAVIGSTLYWYSKREEEPIFDGKLFSPPRASPELSVPANPLLQKLKSLNLS